MFYVADNTLELCGYTDVDWAGSTYDKRSTSGYIFSFGSVAITWSSKKQPTITLSSTEAKYRGVVVAACEVGWLCKLLIDLCVDVTHTVVIEGQKWAHSWAASGLVCTHSLGHLMAQKRKRGAPPCLLW